MTANTASAFSWNAKSGYRQDGVAPAGLPANYAFQKVGDRYYDPTLGCFLTRDTELDQQPYGYCGGDPVNRVDPTGHYWKLLGALAGAGLAIIALGATAVYTAKTIGQALRKMRENQIDRAGGTR